MRFTFPSQLGLSGTPLNESLVCLHKLIPQFKKDNNVQKLHTIVLTDGEHILCLFMTEGGMIGETSGKLQQLTLLHGGDYLQS